jgi:hypothetical protein
MLQCDKMAKARLFNGLRKESGAKIEELNAIGLFIAELYAKLM